MISYFFIAEYASLVKSLKHVHFVRCRPLHAQPMHHSTEHWLLLIDEHMRQQRWQRAMLLHSPPSGHRLPRRNL